MNHKPVLLAPPERLRWNLQLDVGELVSEKSHRIGYSNRSIGTPIRGNINPKTISTPVGNITITQLSTTCWTDSSWPTKYLIEVYGNNSINTCYSGYFGIYINGIEFLGGDNVNPNHIVVGPDPKTYHEQFKPYIGKTIDVTLFYDPFKSTQCIDGYRLNRQGELHTETGWAVTDFIPISNSKTVLFYCGHQDPTMPGICEYDENKNYIGYFGMNGKPRMVTLNGGIKTKYIRLACKKTNFLECILFDYTNQIWLAKSAFHIV